MHRLAHPPPGDGTVGTLIPWGNERYSPVTLYRCLIKDNYTRCAALEAPAFADFLAASGITHAGWFRRLFPGRREWRFEELAVAVPEAVRMQVQFPAGGGGALALATLCTPTPEHGHGGDAVAPGRTLNGLYQHLRSLPDAAAVALIGRLHGDADFREQMGAPVAGAPAWALELLAGDGGASGLPAKAAAWWARFFPRARTEPPPTASDGPVGGGGSGFSGVVGAPGSRLRRTVRRPASYAEGGASDSDDDGGGGTGRETAAAASGGGGRSRKGRAAPSDSDDDGGGGAGRKTAAAASGGGGYGRSREGSSSGE